MAYIISGGESGSGIIAENDSMAGGTANGENVYIHIDDYPLSLTNDMLTVEANGDVLLANAMPQAEYMYGCTPTAVGMILGYYDLYGYRGTSLSGMIEGDVDLESRGTDGDFGNMNAFDTVLGRAIATESFVYRFHSRNGTPTTPEQELEYSFTNDGAGPDIRTDVWDCIADYLGTGQYWRRNGNFSTTVTYCSLEDLLTKNYGPVGITDTVNIRTIRYKDTSMMYGLYLYVQSRGYQMDAEISGSYMVDCCGGSFTFEDYKYEIDSGRPVMISIEGHSMAGYGYNAATHEIIFDDCYESGQRMVWDGTYNYAGADRRIQSITVIGINVNGDMDLALVNTAGSEEKVILAGSSGALASEDYCFAGTTVYLTYSIRNTGTKASGDFCTAVRVDGDLVSSSAIDSLSANSTREFQNVSLGQLDVGMHAVRVTVDENNDIQELSGNNNVAEGNILVLKPGTSIVSETKTVGNGETASDTYVQGGSLILDGGKAFSTVLRGVITSIDAEGNVWFYTGGADIQNGGCLSGTDIYSYGEANVSSGGTATDTRIFEKGRTSVFDEGVVSNTAIESGGTMKIYAGGKVTGLFHAAEGASATFYDGSILDFDLTGTTAGAEALVNDLSIIKGTPLYTLTVDGTQSNGTYKLAAGAAGFNGTISVVNTSGESIGALTVGTKATIDGTDYLLTNENSELSVTVKGGDTPPKAKWTYLIYMAADNNLSFSALYDIVSIQQATHDSQIDIYVLADRSPAGTEGSGDFETINGKYKWDSDWDDTRVGKITYSPGLTVTVDWTSWGELDTGSIETLERFVNWAQEESPAENYGLILWDHGREDTCFCWDETTDPDGGACLNVSEVPGLLKKKGNIPIVIYNACLFASELVVTQMAGSTDVVVVSEPSSYGGLTTYNYSSFFHTITPDMTPQEMAQVMVRNVEPQKDYPGEPTMLTSVDVTDSRLGDALEVLAEAVAAADNDADKDVLIRAMLKAPQNGSNYDGSYVQQSDLGFMIRDVLADSEYMNTSEGFKKALADVSAALEAVVLEYRSEPAGRGSGIAVCNPVYTAKLCLTDGLTTKAAGGFIQSYLTSCYYESNPKWGALLDYLCSIYLAEVEAGFPTAVFSVSDVDGLVDGKTVSVSDIGCFSGWGEYFDRIGLCGDSFFGFVITAAVTSTGSFSIVGNDDGAAVTVSLLAADGTVITSGPGGVSFQDLAVGDYYLRLQSETDCLVTLCSGADWWTGVDRFDYAGSGQNKEHVNGNGSPETATALEAGYYSGLITSWGDADYYLIGNLDAPLYMVEVYGEEGWTVGEYNAEDGTLYEADYADGRYTLMMGSMSCLLVEGAADLANGPNTYSLNVIVYEDDLPDEITLDHLVGTKDGVSWEPSIIADKYFMKFSMDNFEHMFGFATTGTAVDLLNLPAGTYQWRVTADPGKTEWFDGEEIVSDNTTAAPKVFCSDSDSIDDIFFATPVGTWSSLYCAKNVGSVGDWTGTGEMVSAAGKGRIQDLFFGSADPGTLSLTDSENGDALFLDDVYTGLPEEIEENMARLFRIQEIIAGAGDDIIDMTSQRFEFTGGNFSIYGGDGDDVIWANSGSRNSLFGEAGNDRIVGASGDDVIVGGIGNDSMHGGGGDDIFTFCDNWGTDTVEQLETGTVTLWFISGSMENWDSETLTYSDGAGNSVTVSGVSADNVTLKFESAGSKLFALLVNAGAFSESLTKKIFNDTDNGLLAGVLT